MDDDSFDKDTTDNILIIQPCEEGDHPECQLAVIQRPSERLPDPELYTTNSLDLSQTMTAASERGDLI